MTGSACAPKRIDVDRAAMWRPVLGEIAIVELQDLPDGLDADAVEALTGPLTARISSAGRDGLAFTFTGRLAHLVTAINGTPNLVYVSEKFVMRAADTNREDVNLADMIGAGHFIVRLAPRPATDTDAWLIRCEHHISGPYTREVAEREAHALNASGLSCGHRRVERVNPAPVIPLRPATPAAASAAAPTRPRLTERGHQYICLLASGATHREIAKTLGISHGAARSRAYRAYRALGVHDRHAAVAAVRSAESSAA